MIITQPNDGRGLLYHIVNLQGEVVHAYRDFGAAMRSREGDQRILIQHEATGRWITDAPAPIRETERPKVRLARPMCSCCGTTRNLHRDFGSGGPWRCNSSECVMF